MKKDSIPQYYSNLHILLFSFLRILIGWHFVFEGFTKLFSTRTWTAKYTLQESVEPFASAFKAMRTNPSTMNYINSVNMNGLILIVLSLFIGLFAWPLKLLGILLLLFYYFANPPFTSLVASTQVEGNYWIVNKALIALAALFVLLVFPISHIAGIDRYIQKKNSLMIIYL
jgi:thiosulfate dehydrogenase (quinone) large subunit